MVEIGFWSFILYFSWYLTDILPDITFVIKKIIF